jgi:hypothetical protein
LLDVIISSLPDLFPTLTFVFSPFPIPTIFMFCFLELFFGIIAEQLALPEKIQSALQQPYFSVIVKGDEE